MPPDGAEFPHHVPRGISLSSQLFGRPHRCHESWHTPTSPPTPNSKPPRPWGTSSPVRYRPFRYGSNACPPNGAMGQNLVSIFLGTVYSACGSRCGSVLDPHFDPHLFQRFRNKKASKTEVFDAFWSCWADSNRRPHPYQGCALPTELQQHMATKKGLEPSTSSVTGWRSNQLNYLAMCAFVLELKLAYYSKYRAECQHPFPVFPAIFSEGGG